MRYLVQLNISKVASVGSHFSVLSRDLIPYINGVSADLSYLVNTKLLQFFRKFLYADYCWFLFSSNTTYLLRRYL